MGPSRTSEDQTGSSSGRTPTLPRQLVRRSAPVPVLSAGPSHAGAIHKYAAMRDTQPAGDSKASRLEALSERWARTFELLSDTDLFAEDDLYGRVCARLRKIEYQIDHTEREPEAPWCPKCGGEQPEGSVEWWCIKHEGPKFDSAVLVLRARQQW